MSSRGGRDRSRRDYPLRSEAKSNHGRSGAPPSRHLWVGNLSHSLTERALSDQFREFGELESVAFQPARSYAFINFIDDSAAFAAFEALQGFVLAGNALRIEFTKAEKSSKDEDYSKRRDEPPSRRDSRARHVTTDPNENPNSNSKNAARPPSEVLWVGFPESLKVDEDSLWNAFSPFGEIEKISAFPGRTYAFIRYKNINSACRAKDNLQGNLFNNPRVHICFARSDAASSNSSRNLINDPPSPRVRPYGHHGPSEHFGHHNYHEDDRTRISPRFIPIDDVRNSNRIMGRNVPFEQPRFLEVGPDLRASFHDFPIPNKRPLYEDEWDLPEDALMYHGAKKLKSSFIPPEHELPEYPFSESEQVKHVLSGPPEFSQHHEMVDYNLGRFGYHNNPNNNNNKQMPDPVVNISQPYGNSKNAVYDNFQTGLISLPQNPVEWKRATPEPASGEWKWEGIIAKGGTSICRARCFPVGKVLDMLLPEFLDCTARTSLDMLSKHYYQAATSYVVFFVPESDADMAFYNEFMNYLGEKQRAAVAKLDDITTLFLVPPSDFSEKILKVPGKLSISGVILRLEQQPSSSVENLLPQPQPDPYLVSSHGEASRTFASSGPYQPPFQNLGKPRPTTNNPSLLPGLPRPVVEPIVENTPEHTGHYLVSGGRNLMPPNNDSSNYRTQNSSMMSQYGHQETGGNGIGIGIQQEQLAQLASYLGTTRQVTSGGVSVGDEFRQSSNAMISDKNNNNNNNNNNAYRMPQTNVSPSFQGGLEHHPSSSSSQYRHVQQFQQPQIGQNGQGNAQEDPQKRLQATLELAATLLKQIQQGKT